MNAPALSNIIVRHGGWLGKLRSIQEEFVAYRDYGPRAPEGADKSGKILPFVKGLYLSAKLIYFIREVVKAKFEVNWGHVVHESGIYCSPECDIILHRPYNTLRWNGGILDFHFVDVKAVVAVISCKSLVRDIDKDYCKQLNAFGIKSVTLIGEACSATNFENLRATAKAAGYIDFWCLALEEKDARRYDDRILMDFIKYLESL